MKLPVSSTLGLCIAALAACTAAYKPYSVWNDGGFSEHEVQPNRFQVKFVGNEHSTENETEELATLRAAELCLSRRKQYMLLGEFRTDSTESGTVPGRIIEAAAPDRGYGTGRAESETRYRAVPGKVLYTPQTGLTATCLDEQAEGALHAQTVATTTRAKYRIAAD